MLSILIVNWNTGGFLDACLTSLEMFSYSGEQEIIVVDNASTDGSAEMVRASHPLTTLIASDKNDGYAKGNNMAYREARGEWILMLNPDTEVQAGTLDTAVEKLKSNADCAALGARQLSPDGSTQPSIRGFPTLLGIFADITKLGSFFPRIDTYRLRHFNYNKQQHAPQPMGTFLLLRKDALLNVGQDLLDENFPIFFNEVDLLYRLGQAGWNCLYSPDVQILHHGGEGTKQVKKSMIWESHRSLLRFLEKHKVTPWLPLLRPLILFGAWIRAKGWHPGFTRAS